MDNCSMTGWRRRAAVPVGLALLLLAAACTTDDDDGTSAAGAADDAEPSSQCAQDAAAFLEDYDELPTALPDSFEPLAEAPEPDGRIIKIVNGTIPSDRTSAETQAEAAEVIGWESEMLVHDGTVEDLNAKWQQAISERPTAIAGAGFPLSVLQNQIDAAEAAGIVVQLSSVTDTPDSYPGFAAAANGTAVAEQIGEIQANMVMRDSDCTAHVAIFTLPFPILGAVTDPFEEVLEEQCPDCEVSVTEIQPGDLGSPAATNAIVSALQADPSIKYAFTIIANVAAGVDTALSQANIQDVRIFGEVPDENAIAALQDGTNAWWVTQDSRINGFLEVDAILRAIEGEAPVEVTGNPLGVLTQENVPDSSDIPAYPENYQDLFRELWHVE